jgi:hypothetical protein
VNENISTILQFLGPLLGSFLGILGGQKLNEHRLNRLEDDAKQTRKDQATLKERTTRLEGRMDAAESEISDLKQYHKPK